MANSKETVTLESDDIQGIVISGYDHLHAWSYRFLEFPSEPQARLWIKSIRHLVTSADWGPTGKIVKPNPALNIAFTCHGLKQLGLSDGTLKTFAQEFFEGMYQPDRARRLGDVGTNAPEAWEFGNSDSIHALLILQAETDEELGAFVKEQIACYRGIGILEVTSLTGGYSNSPGEHFGFHDGISQPTIEGAPGKPGEGGDLISPGEFVLGYPNEYDVLPSSPTIESSECPPGTTLPDVAGTTCRDLGRNGTYLVARKLEQDVRAFRQFLRERAGSNSDDQEWLAAKLVGRWRSGAPLILSPNADNTDLSDQNDFDYTATDRDGFACPLGAHIRRANPRDSLQPSPEESYRTSRRHRLLRRGVPYGASLPPDIDEDDEKRGLLFVCINADIQRQFEFVQQTWINDPKFNGLLSDPDPLLGADPSECVFTIQGWPVRRRVNGLRQFVNMRGGGYFFLPGLRALELLGSE